MVLESPETKHPKFHGKPRDRTPSATPPSSPNKAVSRPLGGGGIGGGPLDLCEKLHLNDPNVAPSTCLMRSKNPQ